MAQYEGKRLRAVDIEHTVETPLAGFRVCEPKLRTEVVAVEFGDDRSQARATEHERIALLLHGGSFVGIGLSSRTAAAMSAMAINDAILSIRLRESFI